MLDSMLLRKLKEELCHVNLDICGSQEKSFLLKQPEKPICNYTIQVSLLITRSCELQNFFSNLEVDFRWVMNVLLHL